MPSVGVADRVISADGTPIAYERLGAGPALLLVGGAFSHRGDPRIAQLAGLLVQRFSVIIYDRRGRGESGDVAPYAVEREIEDIASLVEVAGEAPCVCGLSSGAVLALRAAASGVSVRKLALYEPPLVVDRNRDPWPRDFVPRLEQMIAADRRGDAVKFFLATGIGVPRFIITLRSFAPGWSTFTSVAHTLPYEAHIVEPYMTDRPLPQEWAAMTTSALAIDGESSPSWLRRAVQEVADVLPNAQRHTLRGQKHQIDPALLAPVLADFFAAGNRSG